MPIAAITSALSTVQETWSQFSTLRKTCIVAGAVVDIGTAVFLLSRRAPQVTVIELPEEESEEEMVESSEESEEASLEADSVSDEEEIDPAETFRQTISRGVGGHILVDLMERKGAIDDHATRLKGLAGLLMKKLGGYYGNNPKRFNEAVDPLITVATPFVGVLGDPEQLASKTLRPPRYNMLAKRLEALNLTADLFECPTDNCVTPKIFSKLRKWNVKLDENGRRFRPAGKQNTILEYLGTLINGASYAGKYAVFTALNKAAPTLAERLLQKILGADRLSELQTKQPDAYEKGLNFVSTTLITIFNSLYDHSDHTIFNLFWSKIGHFGELAQGKVTEELAEAIDKAVQELHQGGKEQPLAHVVLALRNVVKKITSGDLPEFGDESDKDFQLGFLPWVVDELMSQLESDE